MKGINGELHMIDKRIGQRLKHRREELGYTQEQFAEKTGLTINYISTQPIHSWNVHILIVRHTRTICSQLQK